MRDTSVARRCHLHRVAVALPCAAFVLVALLLTGALALAETAPNDPLSHTELSRLAAGQLVTRPSQERRGKMRLFGGASFQVIKRPCDEVWRAVLDTRRYAKLIPTVSKARVVVNQPDYRVVHFEHRAGPIGLEYQLNLHLDQAHHDITFALDPGAEDGPRAAWGFISLRPYTNGATLLSYGVMTDPGDGIVVGLLRGTVHEWLLRVPEQMKRFIESANGRALYAAR